MSDLIKIGISHFLQFASYYYVFINSFYFLLMLMAIKSIRRQNRTQMIRKYFEDSQTPFLPSISVIVPAYNEEKTIVQSVQSFLSLKYPSYEVIVVDDGSKDATIDMLKKAFKLTPVSIQVESTLLFQTIKTVWKSLYHDNLIVVSKLNGGKADALNAGLAISRYELACSVDADSLLEPDALLKVAAPFVEDPDRVIAVGGTVRVVNDSVIENGRIKRVQLSKSWLGRLQVVEYTRSFLCGRTGWNELNSTLIISGAFGLFKKSVLEDIGGYVKGLGEDMELTTRLHKFMKQKNQDYRIIFIPDPVCWTESPESLKVLSKQRDRWQRGLADSIIKHKEMFLNPRYGTVGMIAFPYMVFVELLGPFVELSALITFLVGLFTDQVQQDVAFLYLTASILYTVLISLISVAIDELYFGRYDRIRDYSRLAVAAAIESLVFRQMVAWWRVRGFLKYMIGDERWGRMERTGYTSHSKTSKKPKAPRKKVA